MDPPSLNDERALTVQRPVDLARLDIPVVWGLPLHQALVYAGLLLVTGSLLGGGLPPWLRPWAAAALWGPAAALMHLSVDGIPLWRWVLQAARFLASPRIVPPVQQDPKEVSFHP